MEMENAPILLINGEDYSTFLGPEDEANAINGDLDSGGVCGPIHPYMKVIHGLCLIIKDLDADKPRLSEGAHYWIDELEALYYEWEGRLEGRK